MLNKRNELNAKQKKFCELYATDKEFFANGVESYIESYSTPGKTVGYLTAKSSAYDLLTKPYILSYINELLELRGLNDSFVDKQLELVITQNADFRSKVQAIKEYNVLRQRIEHKVALREVDPILGGKTQPKKIDEVHINDGSK